MTQIQAQHTLRPNLLPLEDITPLVNVPTLKLSPKFLSQITFYHSMVGNSEWSGPLIYSRAGADDLLKLFKDGANETMELNVLEVLLADIGTSSFTSYKYDDPSILEDIMNYQLEGYHLAHCHTHHHMRAFFSGTDNEELQENTPNHKMYLSLIVNYQNGGSYVARICTKHTKKVPLIDLLSARQVFNNNKSVDLQSYYVTQDVIYYIDVPVLFDLDVKSMDRYNTLIEKNTRIQPAREVFGRIGNNTNIHGWARHTDISTTRPSRIPTLFDDPIAETNDLTLGDLANDSSLLNEEAPIPIEQEHIVDFLYYILSCEFGKASDEIRLSDLSTLVLKIEQTYNPIQFKQVASNITNFVEYTAEYVYKDYLRPIEDEEIHLLWTKSVEYVRQRYGVCTKLLKVLDEQTKVLETLLLT